MVEPHMVRVLGRSAFHDTALTVSGDLCYLGGEVYFILSPFSFSFFFLCSYCYMFLSLFSEAAYGIQKLGMYIKSRYFYILEQEKFVTNVMNFF